MTNEFLQQVGPLVSAWVQGPWFDLETLFGAGLGACLVVSVRQPLKVWQTLCSLAMSAGVGVLFTPLAVMLLPQLTNGVAAFFCALVVIPLSIKLMVWVEQVDIRELVRRFKGQ